MSDKRSIKQQFRDAHFAEEDLDDLAAAADAIAKAGYMPEPDVFMMSTETWDAVRETVGSSNLIKTKVTAAGQMFGGMKVYIDDDLPFNQAKQLPESAAIMILQEKQKEGMS